MKIALIACAPLVLLAACAHVQTSTAGAGAEPASGTMYCWQDKLVAADGKYSCNWSASVREACDSAYATDLPAAKVSGTPQKSGRCPNGQWLVSAPMR
jgi:hypothetical protein